MSKLSWLCYEKRTPASKGKHVATCQADDAHAAVTQFAVALGKHHTEFAQGLAAWNLKRTRYVVMPARQARSDA